VRLPKKIEGCREETNEFGRAFNWDKSFLQFVAVHFLEKSEMQKFLGIIFGKTRKNNKVMAKYFSIFFFKCGCRLNRNKICQGFYYTKSKFSVLTENFIEME
jgi:hypothetical protein